MNSNPTPQPVPSAPGQPGRRSPRRRWLPYVGAVVLLGLIAAGLWPQPMPVEIARVSRGLLRSTVNEEGKTRVRERFTISAPVGGQLRRIAFKAGAVIKAGETVAYIDPLTPTPLDARARALAQARRDTAAANLDRFRAARAFALNDLKRLEKLFSDRTISPQELEAAQWRETSAAKDLAAGESALRLAEADLKEFSGSDSSVHPQQPTEVKAPAGGRVLKVIEASSRVINGGAALIEVGNPAELEVVIEVLSRDGASISPGAKVFLDEWGGGEPLDAIVRWVEPAAFTKISALGVEEQRVNVVADLVTPAEKRSSLGDNFRVEARIVIWEAADVLKVPGGALFRQDKEPAVFVMRNGRAQVQRIKTGRSSGTETEVLSGLRDGEEVIVYPGDRIHPAQRIRPIQVTPQ